jgi:acyl-CoA thioester hydrolase
MALVEDIVGKLLGDYPAVITLPIQWGDQDAFGHVNNTVYFRWFESARIEYLKRIDLSEPSKTSTIGPILAAISCNFRMQTVFPDSVSIGARITRLGRSSFAMQHAAVSHGRQAIVADGDSTIVVFEYATNKSTPIPDEIRQAIETIEGRTL